MKTLIAAIVLASTIVTTGLAKIDKIQTPGVGPTQWMSELNRSAGCGRTDQTDPDPRIRATLMRDCSYHQ
jgi:hypothetical protein